MESYAIAFAAFIKSVQTKDAIYYGVSFDATDDRGLAHLVGLTNDEYSALMTDIGLCQFSARWNNWTYKKSCFENFLISYNLQSFCSVYEQQYKGTSRVLFFRIGNFADGKQKHDPGTLPSDRNSPRILGLKKKKEIFKECIGPIIGVTKKAPPEESPSCSPAEEINDPILSEEVTLIKTCLVRQLLPLIVDTEKLALYWRSDIPFDDVADVILRIAQDIVSQRIKKRSDRICDSAITPNDNLALPTFSEFQIPHSNKTVVRGLLRDIITLDSKSKKHNLLTTRMGNDQCITLVRIAQSGSLDRLERNDRQLDFVNRLLDAIVSNNAESAKPANNQPCKNATIITNKGDAATCLITLLGKRFRSSLEAACCNLDMLVGKVMDPIATFAMWSSSNVSYVQQREIARHLRVWYKRQMVCSEEKVKYLLGNDFVAPEVAGVYQYKKEKVPWSCRNPKELFMHYMCAIFNSKDTDKAAQHHHIDLMVTLDHGKGFSRVVLVFICRKRLADGTWTEFQDTFLVASAECAKDKEEILANTFMPLVNSGFEQLVQSTVLKVFSSEQDGEKKCYGRLESEQPHDATDTVAYAPIPMECFVSADIAQYFMNQGREAFSSKWCPYCDLSHKQWQLKGHTKGALWTNKRLSDHAKCVHDKMTPLQRKGVAKEPMFTAIDVPNTIPPRLHIMLGAGNGINKNIIAELQAACEKWSTRYVELESLKTRLSHDFKTLRVKINECQDQDKKRIKQLAGKEAQGAITIEETTEKAVLIKKHELLQRYIKEDKEALVETAKEMEKVRQLPENNKVDGQPVKAAVEDMLKTKGIDGGVYFGGDLQGGAIQKYMALRSEINSDIKRLVLLLPAEQKVIKENHVWDILDAHERLLGHLDGFLSICRVKRFHLTETHLTHAVQHRDNIMDGWRALGLSVTTKMHIIEDHVVDYLDALQGFGDMCEDEGERGHQVGAHNESRSKALRDNKEKATAHAQWESMGKNEDVVKRMTEVENSVKRKRRLVNAEGTSQRKKKERDDGREALLSLNMVPLQYQTIKELKEKHYLDSAPKREDLFDETFVID
jgi:hypothetical protein